MNQLVDYAIEHGVNYFDYYLLHGIGGGMDLLKGRFLDNGILEFLLKEREAGRIKHLGFSYHGDVRDFDWLLDRQEQYHWDFCQIQMNFLDWRHASQRGGCDHVLPLPEKTAADYAERKKKFADGFKKTLTDEKTWANKCQDCGECLSKCPQQIRIPTQMGRIVQTLRAKG